MNTPRNDPKKRRLTAAVIDYDTKQVIEGLAPPVTYSATKRGSFMDFFKINEDRFHEISSNRTPAATRLFLAMTSHANRATQQHLIPHITATQTAIADLARMSQATVSKALKELQAADLVRLQAVNGVPVYQISPFHVWKGANELHRKAQIEWQRSALKQVSA